MKMTVGATWRARANRRAICCSLSPYHLRQQVGRFGGDEIGLALARRRLGQQGLAGARRAIEQEALGRADAEPAEGFGMLQRQLDALAQLVARLVEPADIVPADVRHLRPSPRASPTAGRASAHCRNRWRRPTRRRAPRSGWCPRDRLILRHDPPHRLQRRLAGQRRQIGADEAVGAPRQLVQVDVLGQRHAAGVDGRGSRAGRSRRARRRRSRGRSGRAGAAPRRALRAGWWRR